MADINGNKKRKPIDNDEGEELATEEQKIDKFYALIRNMREARDRLIMINGAGAKNNIRDEDSHVNDNIYKRKKLIMNRTNTSTSTAEEEKKDIDQPSFELREKVLFKVPNFVASSNSSSSLVIGGAVPDHHQKEDHHQMINTKDDLDLSLSL